MGVGERRITKAVFPVAGLGTRFLPATKASPKEMLPVVDRPLIQYAVEEAVAAGIRQIVFVTGRGKRAIEDHFDRAFEMEVQLRAQGKTRMLELLAEAVPEDLSCIYVRQPEMLGLGHAVLCAQPAVGDQPFAVILADDLIDARPPVLQQMVRVWERSACSVVGVQRIAPAESLSYGVVAAERDAERIWRMTGIVEKPSPDKAPSNLGVVGRYVLDPRIFEHLRRIRPGAGGELQLTDAIASLLAEQPVMAYEFDGVRYDCGSKLGYLKANVAFGARHPEVGDGFRAYLESLGADPTKL